jgi:hypothetical protein
LVTGSLVAIADQLDDPVLALLADVGDHVVERNGDVASSTTRKRGFKKSGIRVYLPNPRL